jgi:hypothetical protein
MDPTQVRWEAITHERMTGQERPLPDPTTMAPGLSGLRIRREFTAREAINSRAWDSFHATPPTAISTDMLKTKNQPLYMDMNPIASRTNTVQYRNQMDYLPEPPRGSTSITTGIAPPAPSPVPPPATFSQNPYLQRLDATAEDARNILRELRGAVVEDNRERANDSDRSLVQRQFVDRWLPQIAATDASSLEAYELLRPKQDQWRLSNTSKN